MKRRLVVAFFGGALSVVALIFLLGAGGRVSSPTGKAPDRYVYYPGTEKLEKDEIRIIA